MQPTKMNTFTSTDLSASMDHIGIRLVVFAIFVYFLFFCEMKTNEQRGANKSWFLSRTYVQKVFERFLFFPWIKFVQCQEPGSALPQLTCCLRYACRAAG